MVDVLCKTKTLRYSDLRIIVQHLTFDSIYDFVESLKSLLLREKKRKKRRPLGKNCVTAYGLFESFDFMKNRRLLRISISSTYSNVKSCVVHGKWGTCKIRQHKNGAWPTHVRRTEERFWGNKVVDKSILTVTEHTHTHTRARIVRRIAVPQNYVRIEYFPSVVYESRAFTKNISTITLTLLKRWHYNILYIYIYVHKFH